MDTNYINPLTIYYCGREHCTPRHSFGPAIRQHYLMHAILKGKGRFHYNNQMHRLHAGDAFLIAPGEIAFYEADKNDPWEYIWIGFDGYEVPGMLRKCGLLDGNYIFHSEKSSDFLSSFEHLLEVFQQQRPNEFKLKGCLYHLFSHMLQEMQSERGDSYETLYLKGAKNYIHHNYGYDIHVLDIARHTGIDRTYLFKLFKKEEKISPQEYLINFRIKAAMNMLEQPQFSVTEIAFSCGFKDTPSFSKHFKKRIGITPLQYRKNRRNQSNAILMP